MGIEDTGWFSQRPQGPVRDFFDAYDDNFAVTEASARTLERKAGATPETSVEHQAAAARERMRQARRGDWAPFELHLQALGSRLATAGLEFPVWYEIANSFYAAIMPRLVEAFSREPARLSEILLVLGEYMERSLALIAREYFAARERLHAEIEARHVTERKSAEESRALWAHALDQAQFGVVISDGRSHEITKVNPAYARMLGYEPSELVGSTGNALIADASRSTMAEVSKTLREHGFHTYELQLARKDGSTFPALASTSTVDLVPGASTRVSTVIDISERHRLEQARTAAGEALKRSASRLEILSTTAHEFAAASGQRGVLLELVARRLGEILGEGCAIRLISDDGMWLEPSASFYHHDLEVREMARQVLGAERQRVGEGVAGRVAATGEPVLVPEVEMAAVLELAAPPFRAMLTAIGVSSVLAIPLQSRGRTIGVVSLLRSRPGDPYTIDDQRLAQDLADRAGLAIDNAGLVESLEHRVAQRTSALETANRELEAFSYSVSHDLRAPLRAIDGFSRALLADYEGQLDSQAQHYLQRIRAGTQRMSGLIDDLLNLARITRIPIRPVRIDLSALAGEVLAELRRQDPERQVEVTVAPGLAARADSQLMRIVLENLLGNAWKFTAKRDSAQIWFGVDGRTFHVRDSGAGFDMAHAEKLFSPFQRLHPVKEFEGTGIGLATVHRIIHHHGGQIWAEAEPGRGATLFFTLGDHP